MIDQHKRCSWCLNDDLYIAYHDNEWGAPLFDDDKLFELLILEGMQAGLSWITILKKRENFRKAFDNFDANKIAKYSQKKIEKLLQNPGIIRNRLKVEGVVKNAKAYLQLKNEMGSFSDYLWNFVGGKPLKNKWKNLSQVPATTEISDKLAKDLKKRGFTFVGSSICYAFMQAAGMVNDHVTDCFRYKQCSPS